MSDDLIEALSGFAEGDIDEIALTIALLDAADDRSGLFELLTATVVTDG